MVDIDEADDELPLQVLKNMQAREQFIKGQIESIFVDKSIDWNEYMYIRRTRLEYGISDEEFEYFANSLYEGQMSDRSKVEDDKHEKEKEVVQMLTRPECKDPANPFGAGDNFLAYCGLKFDSDNPLECKLERDNVVLLKQAKEEKSGGASTGRFDRGNDKNKEEFEFAARSYKKCCYLYEECHEVIPLAQQLMKELQWWEDEHERLLDNRQLTEGQGKWHSEKYLQNKRNQTLKDEKEKLRREDHEKEKAREKTELEQKKDKEMARKLQFKYMKEQREKKKKAVEKKDFEKRRADAQRAEVEKKNRGKKSV